MELLRLAPGNALDLVSEFVETPLLRAMLLAPGLRGAWMGPRSPSSAATLLLHESQVGAELEGGPQSLVDALLVDCEKQDVEIRLGQSLGQLVIEAGQVRGVECGADVLRAPALLSCLGPRHTLLDLVEPRILGGALARESSNIRSRGTLASVAFALSSRPVFNCRPDLQVEVAQWAESPTQLERAWDDAKHRRFPGRPAMDLRIHRDEAGWVLHVLVRSAAFDLTGGWNPEREVELGDLIQSQLSELTREFDGLVVGREVLTPDALSREYGLPDGHELQAEVALDQLHTFRPSPKLGRYRTPIAGLWLGSAGSHPGGAVDGRAGLLSAAALLRA
jgi:phytoene dehydrogenase-like protein